MAHINGIFGEPTVYKFEMPGDIEAIEAAAVYGNHAGDVGAAEAACPRGAGCGRLRAPTRRRH